MRTVRRRAGEEGSILILTLCIVALLSIMAYGLVTRVRIAMHQDQWANASSESAMLLNALAGYMIGRMEKDENREMDARGEAWMRDFAADSVSLLSNYEGVDPARDPFVLRALVVDEYGKINVNQASKELLEKLLAMSGETYAAGDIAAAILDWRDADGAGPAEGDYYGSLDPPYSAANDEFRHIEELLFVRDVSPQLFFGEDSNHNGLLDPQEDDLDVLPPSDNGDGMLQSGLLDLLTVYGEGSVNVNTAPGPVLQVLFRAAIPNEADADRVVDAVLDHRRGSDGMDGTEDDRAFPSDEELTSTVAGLLGTDSTAEAAQVVRYLGTTSDCFRIIIEVEMPERHLLQSAEVVVSREDDRVRVLEWHDNL